MFTLINRPEEIELINNKFNIDFESLERLGGGAGRAAFKIDRYSVLKITGDTTEIRALKNLVSTEVILEPGFATVLSDDILAIQPDYSFIAYRMELLYPAIKAFKWAVDTQVLDYKDAEYIKNKTWELQTICFNHQIFDADQLLKEFEKAYLVNIFILTPLILALYEASKKNIFLTDIHINNLGFRFDETGNPAINAGLVAFDLIQRKQ
jgi:hypothetical protein